MNADDVISEVKRLADRIDNLAAGAEHDSQQVPHRAYAATAHREDAREIRVLVAGLTQKMASEEEPVEIVADDQIPEGMNNAHQISEAAFNPRRVPPRQPMSRAEKPTLKECPECEGRIESSGAQSAMCENGHRIELGQIHLPPGVRERLSSRAVEELAEAADASTGERQVSSEGPFRPGAADHLPTQQRHIDDQIERQAVIAADEPVLNRHQREEIESDLGKRLAGDPLIGARCPDCHGYIREVVIRKGDGEGLEDTVTLVCTEGCSVKRTWAELTLKCPICTAPLKVKGNYATCHSGHTVSVGELN